MKIRRTLTGILLAAVASTVVSVITGGVAAHAATPSSTGWLHLKNQGSAQCFDVRNQSTSPGASLQQAACKDIGGQQFQLGTFSDGTNSLSARNSGLCVEVTFAGTVEWVPAQMNQCSGALHQRFHIVPVSNGPVVYYALEPAHVTGFCLRVDPRGPTTSTALILQFRCNGDPAEHWSFF
jgi:hypothetical protein